VSEFWLGTYGLGAITPPRKQQILAIGARRLQDSVARAATWRVTLNRDTSCLHVPRCLRAYIAVCLPLGCESAVSLSYYVVWSL